LKLLIQPEDGVLPLVEAINKAKRRVEIVIFRFDRCEIEKALANAIGRGVAVHALIAYTNRGGEKELRKLEMRLLAAGVTVARTADDLARYHSKYVIIDRRELHLLAFNFTHLDIDHSRSFGLITRNAKLVEEAVRLFEADVTRQPYTAGAPDLVVSPINARKQLAALIQGAKKELLIYDPEVSDPSMIRLLEERTNAGVAVKIIGRLNRRNSKFEVHKLSKLRLHARCILRDGRIGFIGSQSLREVELGSRREVGLIFRDAKIVSRVAKTFHEDWDSAQRSAQQATSEERAPASRVARRVAKAVTKDLPPIAPVIDVIVKEIVGGAEVDLDSAMVEDSVKDAVKEAVKDAVLDAVEDAVLQDGIARGK
jgi:phosphatidylserine/phosphatidylglycerophosphate/cardiolipin synthase-like enzyme